MTLAARDPEQVATIRETGRNPRYAREADLSGIAAALVGDAPIESAELVVVAVPSRVFGEVVGALPGACARAQPHEGARPEHAASGCRRWSWVDPWRSSPARTSPRRSRRGLPAAAVVACADLELAVRLQLALNSAIFRVYVNEDIVGVELCAAAKNVIALAAGGADGLGLGDNAKAALVSRGVAEMRRLAEAAGARPDTFAGLAGMGDLIVTCWSPAGRNRRAGELIAQGATAEEARAEIGMVVEGLTTAPVLRDLSRRLDIELPDHRRCVCCARRRCTHRPRGAADAPRADRPE